MRMLVALRLASRQHTLRCVQPFLPVLNCCAHIYVLRRTGGLQPGGGALVTRSSSVISWNRLAPLASSCVRSLSRLFTFSAMSSGERKLPSSVQHNAFTSTPCNMDGNARQRPKFPRIAPRSDMRRNSRGHDPSRKFTSSSRYRD